MSKTIKSAAAILACASMAISGCSDKARFTDSWTSISPVNLSASVSDATRATAGISIDFLENENKDGGPVTIAADIDVIKTVNTDSTAYELAIPASASVNGTWTYDIDDSDDLLLNLDLPSMKVTVAPDAITITGNLPSGADDKSVKAEAASVCERQLTHALFPYFSRFAVIDDIKVDDKGTKMSFELKAPKEKLTFINTDEKH
ncbi:hypothetical protein [uncultured Muribaculum sp.]|uniref:hypothetical protein n=1 Tax=uncultured Muribaculum sp. TaxID=1918613 RepID=UPI0025F6476D|nr:hypothetical protein [uncultured Muribaculum sp.]